MPQPIRSVFTPEFFEEFAKAQTLLDDFTDRVDKASRKQISLSSEDSVNSVAALVKSQEALVKITDELTLAVGEYKKIADQKVILDARLAALGSDEAKAMSDAAVAVSEKARALRELSQQQNADYQARLQERQLNRMIAEEEKKLQKERADAVKQANREKIEADREYTRMYTQLLKEREDAEKKAAAAAKEDARIAAYASNDWAILNDAYKDAALKSKNYALVLGEQHPLTIQAQKDAEGLYATIKRLSAATGDMRPNVGNYPTAGVQGLHLSLQQIARELPSLSNGLATFFSAIGNNIAPAADALVAFRREQAALRAEGAATTSMWAAMRGAILNWQTALLLGVTLMTVYGKEIADYIVGTKKATEANYDFAESINSLNDALDEQNGRLDRQNKLEVARAKARGASDAELARIEKEGYDKRLKQQDDFIQASVDNEGYYLDLLYKVQGGIKVMNGDKPLTEEDVNKQLEAARKQTARLKLQREDIVTQQQLTDLGYKTPKKSPKAVDFTNEDLKAETDYTQALYEQLKQRSQNSAEAQKAIADDETNNLQKRADAYQNYTFERLNMVGIESAKEQEIIREKLDKIEQIEKKGPEKRTTEEKKLLLQKKTLEVELVTVTEKYEGERTKIITDNVKWQTGLIKQYGKEAEDAIRQAQKNLQGLGDFFSGGGQSQSRDQYERGLRQKLEITSSYVSAAISATQGLFDIEKARSQARISSIQREIDAIEKKKEIDIAAVNASLLTEEEKAKKIADITASAAAQEAEKEERIRQEKRKSAQQEKALNIARISIQTALAVVNELSQGDPITKIPRAIAVGAMGAAELAVAIATPIPEFAVGTESAPEGIAKVHKDELIVPSDGSKPWVVDKDTYTYLTKGTVVKTAAETAEIFKYFAVGMPALWTRDGKEYPIDEIMDSTADKIVRAIEKKRFPTQRAQPAWWQQYYNEKTK